jgi:capsular exopolysaccharide synthesis family protein
VLQTEARAEDSLRSYLRVVSRRKITIAFVTLVVVGAFVAYVVVKKPIYSASAQVLVPEQSAGSALQPTSGQQQDPSALNVERILSDSQQFARGNETAAAARAMLHRPARVSITASTTDDVLTFSANDPEPVRAAAAANDYAKAYISANLANEVGQYTAQVTAIRASIGKLQVTESSLPASSQQRAADQATITTLTQSLEELQATSQLAAQSGPTVIDAAATPIAASSPRSTRDVALGLILGLVLGLGCAFLKDRLDDKITSIGDVEEVSGGLPIVGAIPLVKSWRKGATTHIALIEDPDSTASEAFRTLRTSIQFLGLEDKQQVIGITSSTPDEGKTTVTTNLAVSFARAEHRVVVVSLDFRRPRMHLFFGLDNKRGATSVLLGEATLAEALHEIPGEPNLRVLTSGPVPPNPAEILSLDRLRQLVEVLAKNADIVLLDCPPVLPVTDTLLISRLCDTLLVLTVATGAKRTDLRRTYELLSQVQAPLRGTIVNQLPHRGGYGSGYGYGYGYSYKYSRTEKPAPRPEVSKSGDLSTLSESHHAATALHGAADTVGAEVRDATPPASLDDEFGGFGFGPPVSTPLGTATRSETNGTTD